MDVLVIPLVVFFTMAGFPMGLALGCVLSQSIGVNWFALFQAIVVRIRGDINDTEMVDVRRSGDDEEPPEPPAAAC